MYRFHLAQLCSSVAVMLAAAGINALVPATSVMWSGGSPRLYALAFGATATLALLAALRCLPTSCVRAWDELYAWAPVVAALVLAPWIERPTTPYAPFIAAGGVYLGYALTRRVLDRTSVETDVAPERLAAALVALAAGTLVLSWMLGVEGGPFAGTPLLALIVTLLLPFVLDLVVTTPIAQRLYRRLQWQRRGRLLRTKRAATTPPEAETKKRGGAA